MRPLFFAFIATIVLFLGISCEGDPCVDLECQNGGLCIDGDCDCPENFFGKECEFQLDPCTIRQCGETGTESCIVSNAGQAVCRCKEGYTGDRCAELWTDAYPATYNAQEDCGAGVSTFPMEVESGPDFNQVTLGNFHNQRTAADPSKIVANLLTTKVFDIYPQFMVYGRVSGSGNLNASEELQLFYEVIEGGDTLSCSALLRR